MGAGNGMAVEGAGVAFLAAHFGEEDCPVGDDKEGVFLFVDFEDGGVTAVLVEAEEFGDGIG